MGKAEGGFVALSVPVLLVGSTSEEAISPSWLSKPSGLLEEQAGPAGPAGALRQGVSQVCTCMRYGKVFT